MTHRLFVSAPRRCESALAEELRGLGAAHVGEFAAGVRVEGDLELAYRICLWSRIASRVLLPLGDIRADSPDTLYAEARGIDWSAHLSPRDTFAVDCTSRHAAIGHSHYAALRIKDAIVDQLRNAQGQRPSVDVDRPAVRFRLHLDEDVGRLSLDLAGESLHRRGYRTEAGVAPLKENLAAAVLWRARWLDAHARGLGLLDPMCGAGTLLIEAAFMALDRAPGLGRDYFGFLGWRGHDGAIWQRLVEQARSRAEQGASRSVSIVGRDEDPQVVELARANLRQAGLADRIEVEVARFVDAPPPWNEGLMVVNTPYGERLGDEASVAQLYDELGEGLVGPYAKWHAAILTGAPEVSGRLRRRIKRRHRFYNGNLEVELLSIEPVDASENVQARPTASDVAIDAFTNRVRKNLKRLRSWVRRENITCYRVYDADIPEFSAAVDVYGDWIHLQEYAPPSSIDPAWARARLEAMHAALPELFGVAPEHVVVKTRSRQRGRSQYGRFDATDHTFVVAEGPARYVVNLHDYLDTGLFLDHRPLRARLFDSASGLSFLNLFCYTGSATVAAACGGARSSISVDLSSTYLEWAARNFELNRIAREHRLVRADVRTWLRDYAGPTFDLVFCDPPTFSNSKAMATDFEVERDQVELLHAVMQHVAPRGRLLFSTNKHRFRLDPTLAETFSVRGLGPATVPPDFARGSAPHQVWEIEHRTESVT